MKRYYRKIIYLIAAGYLSLFVINIIHFHAVSVNYTAEEKPYSGESSGTCSDEECDCIYHNTFLNLHNYTEPANTDLIYEYRVVFIHSDDPQNFTLFTGNYNYSLRAPPSAL